MHTVVTGPTNCSSRTVQVEDAARYLPHGSHADIATVVIAASVLDVAAFLRRPGNIHRYLTGVLPSAAARQHQPGLLHGRWAFEADSSGRRFRWWLLAPYRAEGTLDVYGDCSISKVLVSVHLAPPDLPGADVHAAARAMLHGLRRCIETDSCPQAGTAHRLTA